MPLFLVQLVISFNFDLSKEEFWLHEFVCHNYCSLGQYQHFKWKEMFLSHGTIPTIYDMWWDHEFSSRERGYSAAWMKPNPGSWRKKTGQIPVFPQLPHTPTLTHILRGRWVSHCVVWQKVPSFISLPQSYKEFLMVGSTIDTIFSTVCDFLDIGVCLSFLTLSFQLFGHQHV